ncbi:MAG TPA: endonuclease III [Armatimonadota bacterium]|nr:endonuclease III [Armatimonadota bacterium]
MPATRKRKPVPPRTLRERLSVLYPDAQCELHFRTPLELLVATILSAQCTDQRVNIVTRTLFEKYRSAEDYLAVPQEELETDIHSTGFFRNKARNIRGACLRILEAYGGEVPGTMEELLTLPGVARKTANVVLGNIFNRAEGIAVDTHVTRLSGLLGLSEHTDPVKIERDLMARFPRKHWTVLSHLLILHGRRVCVARRPNCAGCTLNDLCPSAFVAARKPDGAPVITRTVSEPEVEEHGSTSGVGA